MMSFPILYPIISQHQFLFRFADMRKHRPHFRRSNSNALTTGEPAFILFAVLTAISIAYCLLAFK